MNDLFLNIIIPAKLDSRRLKNKNLSIINDKTLLEYSIDYALSSKYEKIIIVSTESIEIKKVCKKYSNRDVKIYERPKKFLGDAEVIDVSLDIVQYQLEKYNDFDVLEKMSHMVILQPDHPDRTKDLDEFLDYCIVKDFDDFFTVDDSGTRNGSVRVIKAEYLKNGILSDRIGSMNDNCTNIHTKEDLELARMKIINNIHR